MAFYPETLGDVCVCVCVYFTMNLAILICPIKQIPSAAADLLQGCKILMLLMSDWIYRLGLCKSATMADRMAKCSVSALNPNLFIIFLWLPGQNRQYAIAYFCSYSILASIRSHDTLVMTLHTRHFIGTS